MMSYSPSQKVKAEAELELRRRRRARQVALRDLPIADFAARTKIEVPVGARETALVPFVLWPVQIQLAAAMEVERLLTILKTRQVGVSWEACLFALRLCSLWPGQPVLCLSRGQLEANELVRRISLMYREHADRKHTLARLITDNTADLEWDNGSSVVSLAATKDAGRSHTAALAIIDEWAFMRWPRETLAAVKPTTDAGGKLWIISSADGKGTEYHQHWLASEAGSNGYKAFFIPWDAHPDRGPGWRDEKLRESRGDTTTVYREYPANPIEAFTHAAGLVYDVWLDVYDAWLSGARERSPDGNVTEDADYIPDGGSVYWAVDGGYSGERDSGTGLFTDKSSPQVFLLVQERSNGRLCVFYESYEIKMLEGEHIARVLLLPYTTDDVGKPTEGQSWIYWAMERRKGFGDAPAYPFPVYAAVDSAAAELRGQLHAAQIYTQGKPPSIEESIKPLRRMLAPDANGWRRILVHPRCRYLRGEMASYRRDPVTGKPIDAHNHGPDALRYLAWTKRQEA